MHAIAIAKLNTVPTNGIEENPLLKLMKILITPSPAAANENHTI
jgi:hypothetical protein